MDPNTLRFSKSHEWARLEGGICTVGLTQFAVEQLTDILYVEFPKVGRKVSAEEPFGTVESVKSVNDIYAPVAGEVAEVNKSVEADPSLLSSDPYGKGWLVKLKVAPGTTLDHMLSHDDYQKQIASEAH
jgi:glycine cleavage system H protein